MSACGLLRGCLLGSGCSSASGLKKAAFHAKNSVKTQSLNAYFGYNPLPVSSAVSPLVRASCLFADTYSRRVDLAGNSLATSRAQRLGPDLNEFSLNLFPTVDLPAIDMGPTGYLCR